ncbi:retrovirus-related Pol polyprotein from transposon TNT 1-94 [Senna tora]|uniref:Retrovirus-related Pol polyprotein from transposon TNT 1-94 n=1 Tax=Senna tora TaxID=362788 RepID=A0A835CIV8_9FABA|nr:retrovirus-related Pol polyprotein from transposon TNT 1-94 [Senna tora]
MKRLFLEVLAETSRSPRILSASRTRRKKEDDELQQCLSGAKSDAAPWSLSNSDQPGMALVVAPLVGNNFVSWSLVIKDALEAKDKLGFIDGSIKEPKDEAEIKKWKPVDSMVKSWVRNSISKDIVETFMFCKSARELWKEVEEIYGAKSGPKFFQLQQDLSALRQGNDSVTMFYNKIHKLWDELYRLRPTPRCTCGKCTCGFNKKLDQLEADTRLVQFLMRLNQAFEVIRSQILSLDPLPSINKAFAMVVNVETEKEINQSLNGNQVEGSAMMAKGNFRSENYKKGEDRKTEKMSKYCEHCQQNGHTKEGCFKLIESPIDGLKDKNFTDYASVMAAIQELTKIVKGKPEEQHVNFANLGEFTGKNGEIDYIPLTNTSWIVDTGASSHMCFNKKIMINFRTLEKPIPVHLLDGSMQSVKHTGSVVVQGKIHLHNVFYLPNFKYNLMSVNKLVKDNGVTVFFDASSCMIQDQKTKEILIEGRLLDNLYILKIDHDNMSNTSKTFEIVNTVEYAHVRNNCMKTSDLLLWHERLGHAPIDVLKHIDDINVSPTFSLPKVCDVCHYAKQHRMAFPASGTRVTHVFDIIHLDLCGPYRHPSITNKAHYFLTIVDDYSRVVWTFLLPNKLLVKDTIEGFIALVENQFNKRVKSITTDNGTEFTNLECTNLFRKKGIVHQKSRLQNT